MLYETTYAEVPVNPADAETKNSILPVDTLYFVNAGTFIAAVIAEPEVNTNDLTAVKSAFDKDAVDT